MSGLITAQTAVVYLMITAAFSDGQLQPSEEACIESILNSQPLFKGFSEEQFKNALATCQEILDTEEGLEVILKMVKEALSPGLVETGYAFACDVVASDGVIDFSELEWLKLIRTRLHLNGLIAAVIEYGTRARFRKS